jgi:TrmH family RNA methyltransferase
VDIKTSFERVSSRDNAAIKRLVKLMSSKKERDESGLFACEGARLCLDGFASGQLPVEFYATEDALSRYPELHDAAEGAGRSYLITDALADKISDAKGTQGVFAVFKKLDNWKSCVTMSSGKYVLLDQLQDPGNLGSIMRSCEAFGADGLILSADSADPYSPKALRAAMGGVFRLPLRISDDIGAEVAALREAGTRVYAAVVRNGTPVRQCDFSGGCAVLIGNEGNGLSDGLAALCTDRVTIPMRGDAESLNAGVAAAILIWEMTNM